jgi:hypothetical protein
VLSLSVGGVNFIDFARFAEQWLKEDCGFCEGADLTGDEDVDSSDLEELVEVWLDGIA